MLVHIHTYHQSCSILPSTPGSIQGIGFYHDVHGMFVIPDLHRCMKREQLFFEIEKAKWEYY